MAICFAPFVIALGFVILLCVSPFCDSLKRLNKAIQEEEKSRRKLEEA
ncbi:hypothetical protein KGM48_01875 [Patescibacteria group bacterium]|nr:hypothetical protein [Patescibacteria group bacterium]